VPAERSRPSAAGASPLRLRPTAILHSTVALSRYECPIELRGRVRGRAPIEDDKGALAAVATNSTTTRRFTVTSRRSPVPLLRRSRMGSQYRRRPGTMR
jgi:hypothetical protein